MESAITQLMQIDAISNLTAEIPHKQCIEASVI
jgi:hypothetical protein